MRAQAGDKTAQFQLAKMFEHGEGVTRDCEKARALYKAAAAPSGGTIWL